VGPNNGETRSAALVVAGQTVTLTQSAAATPPGGGPGLPGSPGCTFSISPGNQSFGSAGGPGVAVAVSTAAGCRWSARSNDAWITLVSGASGTGPGIVTFTVAANSAAPRTGTLTIAGQTFTVSQGSNNAPPPSPTPPPSPVPPSSVQSCSYTITPTEGGIKEKGGLMSVAVSAGAGCQWTATSNESWIVITRGASGSGNGTVEFDVDNGKQRTGTLTIAGQTFTVHQNKKGEVE
jgi:hypothetical protein